ncbi:hypothetical protein D3C84_960540 [compost metagenome]
MHMHNAGPLIFATHNQFFAACKQQLTGHRVNTVIGGGNHDLLARLKPVWLFELLIRQRRRGGIARNLQRLSGRHLAERAMTKAQHSTQPRRNRRISIDQG